MRGNVRVDVSANYDRWMRGFGNIQREAIEEGRKAWTVASEMFFDRTQEYAHVLSGEMKASGSAEIEINADELASVITYDSDHAIWEERRGGSHAFITRGWEASQKTFEDAFPEIWAHIVESWR